jgi:hypothetical protein
MRVEGFDYRCSSDDQDGLSIPAEADGSVVPFIGTEKPETSRSLKIVYAHISAGNRQQGLIGTELEIIQRAVAEIDLPRGGPTRLVPNRDLALRSSSGEPPACPAQGDMRDSSLDWPVARADEDEPNAK